jgi:hypothetical protein
MKRKFSRFALRKEAIDCLKPANFATPRDDLVLRQVTLMPEGEDEIAVSFITNAGTVNVLASPRYLELLARRFLNVAAEAR